MVAVRKHGRTWFPHTTLQPLFGPIVCLFFNTPVIAVPFVAPTRRQVGNNGSGHSTSPQIWVPILVVALVITLLAILIWTRKSWRNTLVHFTTGAAAVSGVSVPSDQAARELTAEQLAGGATANGAATTGGAQTGTQGRSVRRPRRTRRTPSQISTTSLPAYMKEPGEQELVIFRGPDDMEDANIVPTTVVMPPVHEDDIEGPFPSADISRASLQDEQQDSSTQQLMPSREMPARQSFDTGESSETSSLLQDNPLPAQDPRGEAPPYFEVIPAESERSVSLSTPPIPEGIAAPAVPAPVVSTRRSGFRTLLSALNPNVRPVSTASQRALPLAHTRVDSGLSAHSASTSEGSHAHARSHRPSNSGGGSNRTQSMFRTISRQRSNNTLNSAHLNSPSMISLNSISSPLSHTLVRTEFTYPKSGPTPEQVKLISSRESFARFGIPYGADAIAYAASASRQELDPPPSFDTPSPDPAAGPSRISHSAHSSLSTSEVQLDSLSEDTPALQTDQEETTSTQGDSSHDEPSHDEPSPDITSQDSSSSISTSESTGSVEANHTSSVPVVAEELVASPTTETQNPLPQQTSAAASSQLSLPKTTAPPSSFRAPSTPSLGPQSRSSSVTSFATAAESIAGVSSPSSDAEFETPHPSEPSTPRLPPQHLHETTDATVMPATSPAAQIVV